MLKGKWLEELGFEIGDYITVSCEDGRLIITLDAKRAALAKAEQGQALQLLCREDQDGMRQT